MVYFVIIVYNRLKVSVSPAVPPCVTQRHTAHTFVCHTSQTSRDTVTVKLEIGSMKYQMDFVDNVKLFSCIQFYSVLYLETHFFKRYHNVTQGKRNHVLVRITIIKKSNYKKIYCCFYSNDPGMEEEGKYLASNIPKNILLHK